MNDITINRSAARIGLGVVAALGLITLAIALVVTGGFETVSYIALGVTIASALGFILLDPQDLVERLTGRTGQYALTTALLSVAFVALVVGLYYVIEQANITPYDVTEASRYQLSEASRNLVSGLEEPVEVLAFFAPNNQQGREEAELWLDAYEGASNGNLTWRFVDPEREPGLAQNLGVENSGTIVFQQGDRTSEVTFPNENNLTNALVQVILGETRIAYTLTGHGERDMFDFSGSSYSNVRENLERVGFSFETLNLVDVGEVPADADVLLILGPQSQFAQPEIDAISAYLAEGGRLLLLSEPNLGTADVLGAGILGVDFAPNGRTFATAGSDGTVKIWDADNATEQLVIQGHSNVVYDVAFSPDGDQLASVSRDGTVKVWEADTGEEIAQLEGHQGGSGGITFSPDGELLASVGNDQIARVWSTDNYEPVPYSPIAVPIQLFDVGFSEDGSLLAASGGRAGATGTNEGLIVLWDAATGDELASTRLHGDVAFALAFNPDGQTIHTVSADGTEGVFNIEDREGATVTQYDLPILDIEFDDENVIYSLANGEVRIREQGESPDTDIIAAGHTDIVWDTALNNNDLVSVSADGDVRIWGTNDGEQDELITAAHASNNLLENYLQADWGLTLNDDFVIDLGNANFTGDPSAPLINNFGQSPIVQGLQQTPPVLVSARSIGSEGVGSINVVNILQTSGANSWGETVDPFVTQPEFNPEEDNAGPVAVGISAENTGTDGRIVIIGDADVAANDLLQNRSLGNAELMINAMNWLAETDQIIDIPSPEFDQATIDRPLSPIALNVTGIALICLLPGAVLITGVVTWFTRRRRR